MTQKKSKQKDTLAANTPVSAPELPPELLAELQTHLSVVPAESASLSSVKRAKKIVTEDDKLPTDDELATPENDAAVDDILHAEGDALLARTDISSAEDTQQNPAGFWHKVGSVLAFSWTNKWMRWSIALIALGATATVASVPSYRYAVLNACGVQASITVVVNDSDTRLPLKNIVVSADDQHSSTNTQGVAKVAHVRLGNRQVSITRFGYKTITQHVVVGWGSNPLGKFYMLATGSQYKLTVNDYVSGSGIQTAEADSGLASANADKSGVITLTLGVNVMTADMTIHAEGYRSEQLHIDLGKATSGTVNLVPAAKAVFITKQSGTYDVAAMDIDGRNMMTLLRGTGRENANLSLAVDATHSHAALVSTRDNLKDSDGYLLNTLTIINVNGGTQIVGHAEQIQLIDWIGTRLIFQEAIAGASASNSQRYKLVSYDYTTNSQIQLASANQFNGVLSAQGQIYFAVSGTDPTIQPAFWRIKPDGTNRQNILNHDTWTAFRSDYNVYATNNTHNLWVGQHNGQGMLFDYDTTTQKDRTIYSQQGLSYPVYWLNDQTAVYRFVDGSVSTDYAVNIANGHTRKIADVVNSSGLSPAN